MNAAGIDRRGRSAGPARPDGPGRHGPGRARPAVDASMSLLTEVMNHPLDPGYAAAARRRGSDAPRRLTATAAAVTVLVAALCGWAATRAVAELRRPQPEGVTARQNLENEIQVRTDAVARQQRVIEQLRAQLATAREAGLTGAGAAALARQLHDLEAATAQLPATGPGLEITLTDAPAVAVPGGDPRRTDAPDAGRVLDRDLQVVVNGLWAAGADAIAVNEQRLGTTTAIRSAGQAILVGYRPLTPPYVVHAIGDPVRLQAGLARDQAGPYLQSLRDNDGIQVREQSLTAVALPAAADRDLQYAMGPGAGVSPAPPSSSPGASR